MNFLFKICCMSFILHALCLPLFPSYTFARILGGGDDSQACRQFNLQVEGECSPPLPDPESSCCKSPNGKWVLVFDKYISYYPLGSDPSAIIGPPSKLAGTYSGRSDGGGYHFLAYKGKHKIEQAFWSVMSSNQRGYEEYEYRQSNTDCNILRQGWYDLHSSLEKISQDWYSKKTAGQDYYIEPHNESEMAKFVNPITLIFPTGYTTNSVSCWSDYGWAFARAFSFVPSSVLRIHEWRCQ